MTVTSPANDTVLVQLLDGLTHHVRAQKRSEAGQNSGRTWTSGGQPATEDAVKEVTHVGIEATPAVKRMKKVESSKVDIGRVQQVCSSHRTDLGVWRADSRAREWAGGRDRGRQVA